MKFPLNVERFEALSGLREELHLAMGVFDGVHLGHKAVIESAVFSARRSGGVSGVLTFDPHPSRLFRPQDPTLLMMGIESKTALLHEVGVDIVIRKHFDREFASIPAEDFLPELKLALPSLKAIYVGENFRFGKMRAGGIATLVQSGGELDVGVFSVDRIKMNGEPISSTRIRKELESGAIEKVNELLGFNYFSKGTIQGGARLGRSIGYPTLNLPWDPECRPRFGVYAARFRSAVDAPWQCGVANYGVKPTVAAVDQIPVLEVHGFDEPGVTEGDSMEVEWLHFIRPERKFGSVELLKEQIAEDCEKARGWFHHD